MLQCRFFHANTLLSFTVCANSAAPFSDNSRYSALGVEYHSFTPPNITLVILANSIFVSSDRKTFRPEDFFFSGGGQLQIRVKFEGVDFGAGGFFLDSTIQSMVMLHLLDFRQWDWCSSRNQIMADLYHGGGGSWDDPNQCPLS